MSEICELCVNGRSYRVNASPETPLLFILRNDLGLKSVRFGCGVGDCGACTILVEGAAVRACQTPLGSAKGRSLTTMEGAGSDDVLSRLLDSMLAHQAAQCGYCGSGVIMAGASLLKSNPAPSEIEVRNALDGNLCRCGAQFRMIRAVLSVAQRGS
jgi:nicotinate dehydrogenase subunit A